jgi:hypothetical protein
MRIPTDSITVLAGQGRITLQVPEGWVGTAPDLTDYPDEWFCRLRNARVPAVGRESGFLFLTRAGFEANKPVIRAAFEAAPPRSGADWAAFEAHAARHFENIAKAVAKEIETYERKLDQLCRFVV